MKYLSPAAALIVIVTGIGLGQSGRKILNQPPRQPVVESPREPGGEWPIEVRVERPMPMPAELSALPEGLLNRDLKSLEDGTFRLSDFGGKVLVVNLWATWCGPCRAEIPDYEKVRKEYAGRSVEFIGLTTEDPRALDRIRKFARDFNFGFRLGLVDRETARTLMNGRSVIPQTLVISTDGRVVSHWHGYSRGTSRDRLRDAIDRALAGTSSR